jgi:hypothetical protein
MRELGIDEELWVGLANAAVLALWGVLPVLLLAYARHSLTLRRIRAEFPLRKSEASELDRALQLYAGVDQRLNELNDQGEGSTRFWRSLFARKADDHPQNADEREDLKAHAQHLRAAIRRLRRQPLVRLKSWVRVNSLQFGLRYALIGHVVVLALLIAAFHLSGQLAWANELTRTESHPFAWYPFDARFFYANAVAASFAGLTGIGAYIGRWARLCQEHWLDFHEFREIAAMKPDQAGETREDDPPLGDGAPQHTVEAEETGWLAVLGLAPCATLAEVKDAYKLLIKQNHPDLLHGMSPALQRLAEAETKKINAAYQQALLFVSPLDAGASVAAE